MIEKKIEELLVYAVNKLSLSEMDVCYVRNALLDLFDLDEPLTENVTEIPDNLFDIITPMSEYAVAKKLISLDKKELFETKVLGLVTPTPQRVAEIFDNKVAHGNVRDGTSWFYALCQDNNYIHTRDIAKNKIWSFTAERGDIVVTINLSKPEKDPKEVAAAKKAKAVGYPKCMLCIENVGYRGRTNFPARQTLRTISVPLGNDVFYFQYSPYSYFDEHCIVFSEKHEPMNVNDDTIDRLVSFVESIPHYFLGSNASLPIVGGSILSHEHYQGGRKVHPMFKCPITKDYRHPDFNSVRLGIVDWYNTVLRIRGKDRAETMRAAKYVMHAWENYSDAYVTAKTTEQHNCITPICRMERGEVFLEFILRNNRTDSEHPYGIFHPTEDMHHIKKEAIGIIETLGIFILPGRLDGEMKEVKKYLTGAEDVKKLKSDSSCYKHLSMINEILAKEGKLTDEKAEDAIREYINDVCKRILYCTAVYKPYDEEQMNALEAFIASMGFVDASLILEQMSENQRLLIEQNRRKKREEEEEERIKAKQQETANKTYRKPQDNRNKTYSPRSGGETYYNRSNNVKTYIPDNTYVKRRKPRERNDENK